MKYRIDWEGLVKQALKPFNESQQRESLDCLKQYESWIGTLRKQGLSIREGIFLGDSQWQKNFSSGGNDYAVFFFFSNTQEGFADFYTIKPIVKTPPDALDVLISQARSKK